MESLRGLLALYGGVIAINVALSAALWWTTRERLYRMVFFVWASTVVSFALQGALTGNDLRMTVGFSSVFLVNLALAKVTATSLDLRLRWRPYAAALALGLLASIGLHWAGAGFTAVALPTCLAVSLPCVVTAGRVIRRRRGLTVSTKALVASSVLFSVHNLGYAFIRDVPELTTFGFTVATLIVFALSVTAPAVAMERVTEERTRISLEMDTTRRIQTRLLPRGEALPGFELATHIRAAEQVGGDYFDCFRFGDQSWLLLGDVTGHGIGAGLVMLMAHSTIGAVLHARPDISPRELNVLANRVLARNLTRLGEQRHMTVVSICSRSSGRLVVSGTDEDLYLFRAASSVIERIHLAHFPMGIGFLPELDESMVGEEELALEPNDVLFVASDGVTEAARGGDYGRGVFGEDAVFALLREYAEAPLETLKQAFIDRLEEFTEGVFNDDVCFIVLRAVPQPAEVAVV